MTIKTDTDTLLAAMHTLAAQGHSQLSSSQLATTTGASLATVKRLLERLMADKKITRQGRARATRYTLGGSLAVADAARYTFSYESGYEPPKVQEPHRPLFNTRPGNAPDWSTASTTLQTRLSLPLAARDPITYQRGFVDHYVPNVSSLLPPDLAQTLVNEGRMHGQQPAGTYARKVLEQLLIDLSWSSSRLEGNRYTLLATQELFKTGLASVEANGAVDIDAVMLLNHKRAIEFLVDAVPTYGLTTALIQNLHAVLLQDLLADPNALGTIRKTVVNISDTVYVPTQVPSLLEEMLAAVVNKARLIKNPVESAFFLWVNLAYLQPFEDGNKRTSRLAANIPLMLYNCAPLSFLDVDPQHYAQAMMGVYEFLDMSLATDLFVWTYRRSQKKYVVVLESMGSPDPVRLRYREALTQAIGHVVRDRMLLGEAVSALQLAPADAADFQRLITTELISLDVHNCARYRLTMGKTETWIADGRPGT
jgi:fido (protein-threonine AMPylation protein)